MPDELTPLKSFHPVDGGVADGGAGTFAAQVLENDDDDEEEPHGGLLRKKSSTRSQQERHHHRRDSSLMELALESLSDMTDLVVEKVEEVVEKVEEVKETVVEKMEEVKDTIVEGMEEIQQVMEEPIAIPVKPREEGEHAQKLSALALAVLVFYKVSGGPFGCEPAVKAAGPFYCLLGFTIFPIIWCIPEALITAELGSAFPEPSGAVAWVEEAMGPQASLLCGYFHWISGATDNAIYPSLFLRYVASYLAGDVEDDPETVQVGGSNLTRFLFTVAITIVLAFINYSGLDLVGNLSMVVCIISMSPFIIMTILAIPKLDVDRWMVLPETDLDGAVDVGLAGVAWGPLLNSLFWNLNSFDVGASFAGEIRDPQRVFPRAMFLSIVLVVLGYLIPLLAALGATDSPQANWEAGYFTNVAAEIGGEWLGAWTVFAAAISNVALFEAEMSGDAYQLMGMADRGLIPKFFTKRSRYGTPTNGILLGTFVIVAVSVADFDQLVEMLNFAYSLSLIMEFIAFVKLRITDDDVERPYRIPLNTFGCILFVIPPMTFLIYLLCTASRTTYLFLLLLVLFGVIFYVFEKFSKHYNWVEYVQAPKRTTRRNVKAGTSTAAIGGSANGTASFSSNASEGQGQEEQKAQL